MNPSKSQFFGMLLHGSTYFRLCHFDVSGPGAYSAHLLFALMSKELDELSDTLIETTQGEEGLFEIVVPLTKLQNTPYDFIMALLDYIRSTRNLFEHSYQQSIIDDIEKLLALSQYKLKFLK